MPLDVAIIGAGAMAREHIRAFADIRDVRIAAIHSRTPEKAQSLADEFEIPLVCSSIASMYQQTSAQLVVIAVPELAARPVSLACFEHPWQVLMEKPPGYHLEDALAIHDAAQRHHRQVMVGLNRRFLGSTRHALNSLSQCAGPRFIHVQDQQCLTAAASIGHPEPVVSNWMYANSIHLIDYLTLFGRGRVSAVREITPWRGDQSQIVLVAVDFESGDTGLYEGIWKGPGPWAVSVSTEQQRWEMRPLEEATVQIAGQRTRDSVPAEAWDEQFKPGFRMQAEHVVRAVRQEPSDAVTLPDALATMRLIANIFPSLEADAPERKRHASETSTETATRTAGNRTESRTEQPRTERVHG